MLAITSDAPAAANAPPRASSSATERRSRWGRSTQRASAPATTKKANASSRSRKLRPNADERMSGTTPETSKAERSANWAVDMSTYTGIATSATADAIPNATDTQRRLVPRTRRTTGLAIAIRRMKRPIAAMTARNTTKRATISSGVAAVSEIDGIANSGAGPGFGPTANVNAPRTGWPSAEITRQ